MALSNIFREPRREITESVVGIIVTAGIVAVCCMISSPIAVALRATDMPKPAPWSVYYFVAFIIELVVALLFIGALAITHAIGDGICNALARRGLELRPKTRYR